MRMLLMAITYGDDPAPLCPPDPSQTAVRFGSLAGRTIPTARAPQIKKTVNRQYMVLKAELMSLRGDLASPATMQMNSGPQMTPPAMKIPASNP